MKRKSRSEDDDDSDAIATHDFFCPQDDNKPMLASSYNMKMVFARLYAIFDKSGLYYTLLNHNSETFDVDFDELGSTPDERIISIDTLLDQYLTDACKVDNFESVESLSASMTMGESEWSSGEKVLVALRLFTKYNEAIIAFINMCEEMISEYQKQVTMSSNVVELSNLDEDVATLSNAYNDFVDSNNKSLKEAFHAFICGEENTNDAFGNLGDDGMCMDPSCLFASDDHDSEEDEDDEEDEEADEEDDDENED